MSKKILSWLLTFVMIFSMFGGFGLEVFGQSFTDIQNHWAKTEIEEWNVKGLISGYGDGTFKPNNNITRAEFITLINNVINIQVEEEISFDDVEESDWYYKDLRKAIHGEYISGYEDNTFRADENISRQEVAVILQNLIHLKATELESLEKFNDTQNTPDWSKTALQLAVQKGYLSGYKDHTLKASNYITRAESVKVLNNIFGIIYNESGVYGPSVDEEVLEVKGNVTVSVQDITLQNMIIDGDLYLAEGIGEGDVTLDNITVMGETIVNGGGDNSIIIKNSSLTNLLVIKKDGKIRIVAQGNTTINETHLYSSVKLQGERLNANSFGKVEIIRVAPGQIVEFEGSFNSIDVKVAADIEITGSSKVDELNIHKDLDNINILVSPYSVVDKLNANSEIGVINRGIILEALGDFARVSNYDVKLPVNLQPRTSSGTSTPSVPKYSLSLSVNPVGSGTVTGAGSYEEGKAITVTAIANDGYEFVEWKDGDSQITTSASFSYTTTSENKTFTANFESTSEFAGGSGLEGDPYQVATAEQLNNVRNHLNAHFIQIGDIDLGVSPWNEGEGWEPIGNNINKFKGFYNGNAYDISYLFIDRPSEDYQGLFGYVDRYAYIEKINLKNSYVSGDGKVGTLVGRNDGMVLYCNSNNLNLYSRSLYGGGLVGENYSSIANSSSEGVIKSNSEAGGLVGYNFQPTDLSYAATISSSYSNVEISKIETEEGSLYKAGGLVGYNTRGTISNSYALGNIINAEYAGGLVADDSGGVIKNSYSVGSISGTNTGGLIENSNATNVSSSYYNSETSGQSDIDKGTPKTTDEMQDLNTYNGWNFVNIWTINNNFNNGYPTLRWVEFAGGSGSESDPYQIATPQHLDNVRNYLDKHFIQVEDIDLTDIEWEPIGAFSSGQQFVGSYNGNNKTINRLTIIPDASDQYVGLFGVIGYDWEDEIYAQLSNISLTNVIIRGTELHSVGSLVGRANNNTTIDNCSAFGEINALDNRGYAIGGLVGDNSATLTNSEANVTIYVSPTGTGTKAGGLAGHNGGSIDNCFATGDVTGNDYVGGLLGWHTNNPLTNSYSTGNVTGDESVGGLIGLAWGITEKSFSNGHVNGNSYVGGLIGNLPGYVRNVYASGSVTGGSTVGGLVGFYSGGGGPAEITNAYAYGQVSGSAYTGGLVGSIWESSPSAPVTSSYWDTETTGRTNSVGGTGYVTSAMIKETNSVSIYIDWDFDTIWGIHEGNSYPYLRNNRQIPPPMPYTITVYNNERYDGTVNKNGSSNYVLHSGPSLGTLVFNSNGSFSYTSNQEDNDLIDTDLFTYTLNGSDPVYVKIKILLAK
ncbi:MAG: S-layer homology domain-containing protein [Dethiosulfatibacter sp.]|nr:S-layer homology domain-containing protein [Dethiosulfatibacter sp.]